MIAKRFFVATSIAVFFASPLSVAHGEERSLVPRQAALTGLPNNTPLLGVDISGGRVIGVGAYGKILVGEATALDTAQVVQVATPIDVTLTSIAVLPDGVLIAGGHEATLLRSVDNGDSWDILSTDPSGPPILKLICLQEGVCIAVGGNGLVLRSADKGNSWKKGYIAVEDGDGLEFDPHLFALVQLSNGRVVATGEQGFVFVSDDSGQTWRSLATDYKGSLFSVAQLHTGSIVAFGMSGNVVRSADAGSSWTQGKSEINDVVFASKSVNGELILSGVGGLFEDPSDDNGGVLQRRADYQVRDFVRGSVGQYFLGTSVGLRVISLGSGN